VISNSGFENAQRHLICTCELAHTQGLQFRFICYVPPGPFGADADEIAEPKLCRLGRIADRGRQGVNHDESLSSRAYGSCCTVFFASTYFTRHGPRVLPF
jgi:hypothetical protein